MKVFFGTTTSKLLEYYEYYSAIRKTLIENDCVILFDWLERAYERKLRDPDGKRDIHKIYKSNVDAINKSDFIVIEYTVPNFSSSHQINHAIFRQKPVLVLRLQRDNSFADSYIEAVDSPFITIRDYTLDNLNEIITEFIGINEVGKGFDRYNIVLDKKQKYYLDWAHVQYNKSRSELIREALTGKIQNDDQFAKYLRN